MALFKVLRGSSGSFHDDLSQFHNWGADGSATLISNGAIALNPKFNDGFCYFLKDSRMFYIDYAIKDGNGNITERHRVPLNADDAQSIENTIINRLEITDSDYEIPTAKLIKEEIARIDLLISQIGGDAIEALQNDKMDKEDPTGTGSFSMNGGEATGTNSVAWADASNAPEYTTASGYNAFAMGLGSTASGHLSFARGETAIASGDYSHADGYHVNATQSYTHAEGNNTTASAQGAHAEGEYTTASGQDAHTEGYYTEAQGKFSHAEGNYTTATHKSQHVEGEWNALDSSTNAATDRGTYVHITGIGTDESNRKNGFTVDWNGNLWSARSIAHGNNVSASGENSYAGGNTVVASGVSAHAEGSNNEARGSSSHTEGDSTYASNRYSHAEGKGSRATNQAAHAEGYKTQASGLYSHAEGNGTNAQGAGAHSEGQRTTAAGEASHSEGNLTIAYGSYSHAGGQSGRTNGIGSFAHGLYVTAYGDYSTVFGKYNTLDTNKTLAFAIGNGTADRARKNIFQVAWNGSAYLKNRLNIAGLDLEQDAAGYTLFVNGPAFFSGTVKAAEPIVANDLATKNYVDNNLPRMTHSWITATAGQSVFDFTTPDTGCPAVTDLANYYYVYFNGLLLIPDLHYSISGSIVTFIGWAAEAGDVCHIVGFKPINPTV